MPGVFGSHSFPFKYVTEVAAAIGTHNLGPFHTKGSVGMANNGTRNFIVERWPAAAAFKLVRRAVQRCIAPATNKHTRRLMGIIFAGKGSFRAFMHDNLFFFGCECVPVLILIFHAIGFYALPTNGPGKSYQRLTKRSSVSASRKDFRSAFSSWVSRRGSFSKVSRLKAPGMTWLGVS